MRVSLFQHTRTYATWHIKRSDHKHRNNVISKFDNTWEIQFNAEIQIKRNKFEIWLNG